MNGEESPAFDPAVLPEDGPGANLIYRLTLAGIPSLLVATVAIIYLLPEDVIINTRGIVDWFAPHWIRIRVDVSYIGSFSKIEGLRYGLFNIISLLVVVASNIILAPLFYFYLRKTPRTLRSDDISVNKRGYGLASMLVLLAFATYIPAPFLKGKWDFGVPEQFALPYALFCWIFAQIVVGSIFGKIGKERIIFERSARDRRIGHGKAVD